MSNLMMSPNALGLSKGQLKDVRVIPEPRFTDSIELDRIKAYCRGKGVHNYYYMLHFKVVKKLIPINNWDYEVFIGLMLRNNYALHGKKCSYSITQLEEAKSWVKKNLAMMDKKEFHAFIMKHMDADCSFMYNILL